MRIAVLVSGTGTNLRALINESTVPDCPYTIDLVVADSMGCMGLIKARNADIPTHGVDYKNSKQTRQALEDEISRTIEEHNIDLIVLAGYMRIVSSTFVDKWRGRLINLHPSLLPAFPGKDGIQQAFDYGAKITGVSVHYVDYRVDSGEIIDQQALRIDESWSIEILEQKIHEIEHKLLPSVVKRLATVKNI